MLDYFAVYTAVGNVLAFRSEIDIIFSTSFKKTPIWKEKVKVKVLRKILKIPDGAPVIASEVISPQ